MSKYIQKALVALLVTSLTSTAFSMDTAAVAAAGSEANRLGWNDLVRLMHRSEFVGKPSETESLSPQEGAYADALWEAYNKIRKAKNDYYWRVILLAIEKGNEQLLVEGLHGLLSKKAIKPDLMRKIIDEVHSIPQSFSTTQGRAETLWKIIHSLE